MNETDQKIWFPAMKRGWGWGLPIAWQGWVVFVAYLGLATAGALAVRSVVGLVLYLAYVLMLSAGFLAVCWLKGEKPEWR